MEENSVLLITPQTRIGELLETYPHLEPLLLEIAPAFRKLKNPILRKTVGKVATLQQASAIGNVPISQIINILRAEVQQEIFHDKQVSGDINYEEPDWFDPEKVTVTFDAMPLINAGKNPMQEIFRHLEMAGSGEIFMLSTPFVPAPIIELIHKKGYNHYCHQREQEKWDTYFSPLILINL